MVELPFEDVAPFDDWPAAARASLSFLHSTVGLDVWMLTRVKEDQQVVLHAQPRELVPPGTTVPWDRSFCRQMVIGEGPRVATVTAVTPAYSRLLTGHPSRVAAYLGVPLVTRNGELFGTLCGVSARAQPRSFVRNLPLVELIARMLSTMLPADPDEVTAAVGPPPAAGRHEARRSIVREGVGMSTPEPDLPQPRDIALEQETPEQAEALEAASEAESSSPPSAPS